MDWTASRRIALLHLIIPFIFMVQPALADDTVDMFKTCLEDQVRDFTLENGMRFILIERTQIPVFSAIVLVGVGSVDEPPGKTGVAHVFEHMAFKGTTTVGTRDYQQEKPVLDRIEELGARLTELRKDKTADPAVVEAVAAQLRAAEEEHNAFIIDNGFDEIYTRNGANFVNAGTSRDFTMYMVSLPANRLELWARMEADRLMNPVFRQFYKERDVIMEERRMGTDNSDEGELYEEFAATAYRVHPYGSPVIGWMNDIQNLTIADARDFHQRYYVPRNITIAIAGDIRMEKLREIAGKYFAVIPDRPAPPDGVPEEPPQNHLRTVRVVREDANPAIRIAWHMPGYPDREAVALDIASQILGTGRTARLYKRLVEGGLAVDISVDTEPLQRYDGLFTVRVKPKDGVSGETIIEAVLAEIRGLSETPLTQFEIDRIKKKQLVDFVRQLEANMWLAVQLAYFENIAGDWRQIGGYMRDINTCSAAEISAAAEKYLKTTNYTLAILEKPKTVDEPETAAPAAEAVAGEVGK